MLYFFIKENRGLGFENFNISPEINREILEAVRCLVLILVNQRFDDAQRVKNKMRRYLVLHETDFYFGELQFLFHHLTRHIFDVLFQGFVQTLHFTL